MSDMKTIQNLQVNVLDLDENEVSLADLCAKQATLLVFLRQFG
jgi:hypothetical protein